LKKLKAWNKTAKIRSALRQVWRWSPLRQEALKKARIGRGSYLCAGCGKIFGPKDIAVDHVEPVTPIGWDSRDWTTYVDRLFGNKLQILCRDACHKEKTAMERKYTKAMTRKKLEKPL
jgi:5-methylcytosine-specific restriction endonuclease McrA